MNWILFLAFCISIQKLDFFILNFGKSKLEKFILTPKSGQGQDIPSYLTRERKFLISLSCMRINRLTRKWHISWKIWHFMKWFIRTKQIHLCLGLHTCKENYPCGTNIPKIRFSNRFTQLFWVISSEQKIIMIFTVLQVIQAANCRNIG